MSQGIRADSDVGGRGCGILSLKEEKKKSTKIASGLASDVCCRGTEKAVFYHTLLCVAQNCDKQTLSESKQMASPFQRGYILIHIHNFFFF